MKSLTALVEYDDGRFEIIGYKEFCRRLDEKAQLKALNKLNEEIEHEPVEEDENLPTTFSDKIVALG